MLRRVALISVYLVVDVRERVGGAWRILSIFGKAQPAEGDLLASLRVQLDVGSLDDWEQAD